MKAVIFIDVQNDFLKGGKLAYGYPEKDNFLQIVEFAKACRDEGHMLYATADTHNQETYCTTLEGKMLPVEHCIEGTRGHQLGDGLVKDINGSVIIPQGHIIDKNTFGSFDLLARIDQDFVVDSFGRLTNVSKYDGIGEPLDEIVICGYCLSICVMANAVMLRAKYPNVKITVKTGLCGDVDKESFDAAVKVLTMQQINVE